MENYNNSINININNTTIELNIYISTVELHIDEEILDV